MSQKATPAKSNGHVDPRLKGVNDHPKQKISLTQSDDKKAPKTPSKKPIEPPPVPKEPIEPNMSETEDESRDGETNDVVSISPAEPLSGETQEPVAYQNMSPEISSQMDEEKESTEAKEVEMEVEDQEQEKQKKKHKSQSAKTPRKTPATKKPTKSVIRKDESQKHRKPHRFKPGTKALMQIRQLQKTTHRLMQKAPVVALLREIIRDSHQIQECRLSAKAIEAFQTVAEEHLMNRFFESNHFAVHAKRKTVMLRDYWAVRRFRHDQKSL